MTYINAIRPSDDITEDVPRLSTNPALIAYVSQFLGLDSTAAQKQLQGLLGNVTSSQDLQTIATQVLSHHIFEKTDSRLVVSGTEHLPDTGYLLLAPHYLITDPAVTKAAVLTAGKTPPIAVAGHNLYSDHESNRHLNGYSFVDDIFRLASCMKTPKEGDGKNLLKMGMDIYEAIVEQQLPVHIAQQAQRNKDGLIRTAPILFRMIAAGARKSRAKNSNMTVLPLATTIEYIPTDVRMAYQLVTEDKNKGDDALDMLDELRLPKGTTHLHFCEPITVCYKNPTDAAHAVDEQILQSLRPNNTQMDAYKLLHEPSTAPVNEYLERRLAEIPQKYPRLKPPKVEQVKKALLHLYAGPVKQKIEAGHDIVTAEKAA